MISSKHIGWPLIILGLAMVVYALHVNYKTKHANKEATTKTNNNRAPTTTPKSRPITTAFGKSFSKVFSR